MSFSLVNKFPSSFEDKSSEEPKEDSPLMIAIDQFLQTDENDEEQSALHWELVKTIALATTLGIAIAYLTGFNPLEMFSNGEKVIALNNGFGGPEVS